MNEQLEFANTEIIRTTVRMPLWLHDELRRASFLSRRSINELVIETLEQKFRPVKTDDPVRDHQAAAA
ncbi:hypothetical protein [Kallotenue papyrolyticum]|uniref:hypothetical protein n=1 Tax=Kallotenue papyrolyticum TaxID=1325125 RepID=UPI0004785688|nr:hypothetical protein [Kallotenue papyrolyticum]